MGIAQAMIYLTFCTLRFSSKTSRSTTIAVCYEYARRGVQYFIKDTARTRNAKMGDSHSCFMILFYFWLLLFSHPIQMMPREPHSLTNSKKLLKLAEKCRNFTSRNFLEFTRNFLGKHKHSILEFTYAISR